MKYDDLKNFMADVWEYHNLFSKIELAGQPLRIISDEYENLNTYEIAYSFLPKKTLETFFYYGKNDYGLDIEYQYFIELFIGKRNLIQKTRYFNIFYQSLYGSKKYIKKDHHKKKIKIEHLQSKENWRQEKKMEIDKRRSQSYHYRPCSWELRKTKILKKIQDKEASIEINQYIKEHIT